MIAGIQSSERKGHALLLMAVGALVACGHGALPALMGGFPDGGSADGGSPDLRGGWAWANPQPFGDDVASLWSPAAGDGWAGTTSRLLQFDGAAWSSVDFDRVLSISGRGTDDVWVTTGPSVFHWDGTSWTEVVAPRPLVLALLAPEESTDVWALGFDPNGAAVEGGTLFRYSNGSWAPASDDRDLRALSASPDREISATGWYF